ncbi:YgcG family protein [Bradyrhizobium lablabi]|uniref:TPM domain-containing protein n=1 Tax=Bradyrhizobium lablabi TaxID=722472 RepID=UPI001BA4424B|nr:YgcG family protein [Bradyrhizobium lablabi]MBR1125723.1 YgcG family protein [Bradyrhizobium lablabi]
MNAARVFVLALLLGWVAPALALVAVPPLTGRVVDRTGTLSSGDVASLTQTLQDLQTRKGSQIAVLIVPTTEGEPIEQYALRVAEAWKIGRKKIDDGALLVIARNDRHLRIEVGYGLEGALTDATTKRIIDEVITPKFKSGDFAGGISAGVNRMIGVVNGEKLPAPEPAHWDGDNLFDQFNPFWIMFALAVSGILRGALGRLVGAGATGGVLAVVAWFLFGSLTLALAVGVLAFIFTMLFDLVPSGGSSGAGGGGSWSSGSSRSSDWSSSSSSGSSSGGFSGGGGSFGGGGASGSW